QQTQQRRLTGAVVADEADAVAFTQVQVDVPQRLDDDGVVLVAPDRATRGGQEGLLHGTRLGVEDGEVDAGVVGVDGYQGRPPRPSSSRGNATASWRAGPAADRRRCSPARSTSGRRRWAGRSGGRG